MPQTISLKRMPKIRNETALEYAGNKLKIPRAISPSKKAIEAIASTKIMFETLLFLSVMKLREIRKILRFVI